MNLTEELIWSYLDGECTEEERLRLERLFEDDPTAKVRMLEARQLKMALEEQEAEIPSMGFASRVMDRIAALPQLQLALLSTREKQRMGIAFSVLVLSFLGVGIWGAVQSGPSEGGAYPWLDSFFGLFALIPSEIWTLSGSLSIGLILLMMLDKRLKRMREV